MNKARLFFKLSDIFMDLPRNRKRYPDICRIKDGSYDPKLGRFGTYDCFFSPGLPSYPVLVNVHGGGFVRGDKKYRRAICSEFARAGWLAYNINYSLAPASPLPQGALDAISALECLPSLTPAPGVSPDLTRVVLSGDSAGAFYALSATLACSSERYRKLLNVPKPPITPAAFLGFFGAYRLGDILRQKTPLGIGSDIAASLLGEPNVSVSSMPSCPRFVYSDLIEYVDSAFPRTFLVHARRDAFCGGQAELLIERLKSQNVPFDAFFATGEKDFHCFHLLPNHPSAAPCLESVMRFLDSVKNGPGVAQ